MEIFIDTNIVPCSAREREMFRLEESVPLPNLSSEGTNSQQTRTTHVTLPVMEALSSATEIKKTRGS